VVAVDGAKVVYQIKDMDGQVVEVAVPSTLLAIRKETQGSASTPGQSDQSDGTIEAKVVAVDTLDNRIKVLTPAGQTIELAMPAQDIQVGEPIKLVVP
jgi:hypothetical protein